MIKRNKILAYLMVVATVLGSATPAMAADISVTGDTTGNTPTQFVVDEDALGGGLTVTIPASLELVRDGETGDYGVEDVVSAQGNMNPSKVLCVSANDEIVYTNIDAIDITVTGTVTFGTDGAEEWTAAQTKASLTNLDSRPIDVTVDGSTVDYLGRYWTVVEFDIAIRDAVAAEGAVLMFSTTETEATVTGLADGATATNIEIPDTYNGLPVTTIADYAFIDCVEVENVTIPSSVNDIGAGAFYGTTWLENQRAASENGLVVVNDILIDAETASGDVVIPSSVKAISDEAFYMNETATSVVIPEGITSLGKGVFVDCTGLVSVTVPSTVTSIGRETFSGCKNLETVDLPSTITSIDEYAFSRCERLANITMPSSLTSLGNNAFDGCKALTSVTIPSGVDTIGIRTFANCQSLENVTISEGVTTISAMAFTMCYKLENLTIPTSVTSITYAFDSAGLTNVTYDGVNYTSASALVAALEAANVTLTNEDFSYTNLAE